MNVVFFFVYIYIYTPSFAGFIFGDPFCEEQFLRTFYYYEAWNTWWIGSIDVNEFQGIPPENKHYVLKINGWKMHFLLNWSLSKGHSFVFVGCRCDSRSRSRMTWGDPDLSLVRDVSARCDVAASRQWCGFPIHVWFFTKMRLAFTGCRTKTQGKVSSIDCNQRLFGDLG